MKFNPYVGLMAVAGLCLFAKMGSACTIIEAFIPVPIDCVGENTPLTDEKLPDNGLQVESMRTAGFHSDIVDNENNYVSKLGKEGGGSLKAASGGKINKIAREMRLNARDSAAAVSACTASVNGVTGNYSSCKSDIEKNLTVKADTGVGYSTTEKEVIKEAQRVAVNDVATYGLSMASATSADVSVFTEDEQSSDKADNSNLTAEQRAKEIAKANTVQGMYEMMMILDRATYERSLKAAGVEASNASIQAIKLVTGVSDTADAEIADGSGK